jgi:hypothetical protein
MSTLETTQTNLAESLDTLVLYSCAPDQLPGANNLFRSVIRSGVARFVPYGNTEAARVLITGGGQGFDYYVYKLPDPSMTEADAHWNGLSRWARWNKITAGHNWRGIKQLLRDDGIRVVDTTRSCAREVTGGTPELRKVARFVQWPIPLTNELREVVTDLVFAPNYLSSEQLRHGVGDKPPAVAVHLDRLGRHFGENAAAVHAYNQDGHLNPRRILITTLSWASNRARLTGFDSTSGFDVVVQSYDPADPLQTNPITRDNWYDDSRELTDGSRDKIALARVVSELPRLLLYSEPRPDGSPGDVHLRYEDRQRLELVEGRLQEKGFSLRTLPSLELTVR